jgi:DNA polymerase I-like protein with 3'-5' exonuclease and polymerase domains
VTNLVHTFRDYQKPTAADIAEDHDELVAEIIACAPEIIGLVGGWSVEWVLSRPKAEMEKVHGVPIRVNELFGGELSWSGIVLPVLHPAGAIHSPDSLTMILDDMLTLGKLLDGELSIIEDTVGETDYRIVDATGLSTVLTDDCHTVAIDTETHSTGGVLFLQISLRPGTGYVIRGDDKAAIDTLLAWLRRVRPLVLLQNALFDIRQLKPIGVDLFGEGLEVCDTMVLAYELCCEPQSLKLLAYRHCGMEMQEYSEVIGNVGEAMAMDYLYRVLDREWPNPEPEIVREGNGTRVRKSQNISKTVQRILMDIASGKTLKDGSATDPRDRWKKIDARVKAPVIAVLGEMRAPDLSDIPLDKAVYYSGRDPDATLRVYPALKSRVDAMELGEVAELDHGVIPMIARMAETGIQLAPEKFWDDLEAKCIAQMDKAKYAIYQATGRDLNPASGDQVADLLYGDKDKGGLGLVLPMLTDGGTTGERRGSTNDKCLEALLAENPVVEHVELYREADKVRGTYVEPLREMARTGDGRARVTFKITRQVTGRFTTAEPMNLLSIPVRTELGKQCRYGFIAPDGKVLFDADLSQIEMRTFAHLSRDEKLCKVFIDGAKLRGDEKKLNDIHNRTASEMFGVPISRIKPYQRQSGKVVGFFIINGGSPKGLVNQMILFRAHREDGGHWTEDDCERMISAWFKIYPGCKRFQNECIAETQATGLARDPLSGRIRYLPQIWSPKRQVREEAERCSYSHLIQTSANTVLKRAMKVMWDNLRHEPGVDCLLPPHDETLWELPDDDGVRGLTQLVVERALTQTTKLIVPIEASSGFGQSWGEAH